MLRRILVMPIVYGLLVIFVACAQPGAVVVRTPGPATATGAASATPALPTAASSTSAATPTDAPATATPTQAAPLASRTPTIVPPTVTATPTDALPTGTPVLEALDTETTTTTSPDGAWVAVSEAGFPVTKNGAACAGCSDQYWTRFTVRRADGTLTWTPMAEWRQMGLGYTVPAVLQWSADGMALYVTEVGHPDGCGFAFSNGSNLRKLDLGTGHVTELLPSTGYWLTLSPDETQVAYMAYGQRGMVVRDLATSAEQEYPLADLGAVQAGAIVWSPDAVAVALTVATNQCINSDGQAARWVIAVTLADGARRVVLPPDDRQFTTTAWPEADRLSLVDAAGARWGLTISSGQLTPEG